MELWQEATRAAVTDQLESLVDVLFLGRGGADSKTEEQKVNNALDRRECRDLRAAAENRDCFVVERQPRRFAVTVMDDLTPSSAREVPFLATRLAPCSTSF